VEARGELASFLVGINNAAVELHYLTEKIHIVGERAAIVFELETWGWVQDESDHKVIVGVWVVSVLEVKHSPELEDAGNNRRTCLWLGH
jgi:hypothetical protein